MRITIVKKTTLRPLDFTLKQPIRAHLCRNGFSLSAFPQLHTISQRLLRAIIFEKEVFALIKADINLQNAKDVMSVVADAISKAGINVEQTEDGGITLGKDEYYKSIIDRAEKNLWRKMEALEQAIITKQQPK